MGDKVMDVNDGFISKLSTNNALDLDEFGAFTDIETTKPIKTDVLYTTKQGTSVSLANPAEWNKDDLVIGINKEDTSLSGPEMYENWMKSDTFPYSLVFNNTDGWYLRDAIKYTVSFETNGGNKIDSVTVYENSLVEQPNNPLKKGSVFVDWFSDKECTKKWNFDKDKVTGDMTLYADWKSNIVPPKTEKTDNTIETSDQSDKYKYLGLFIISSILLYGVHKKRKIINNSLKK
ncbi:MAG: InlB B-repeat-containing protein [Coprobacillaceae bacterium]